MKFLFPVGLYSDNHAEFAADENSDDYELVAHGIQNVWICEVGSAALNGSFEEFSQTLRTSQVFNGIGFRSI